MVVVEGVEVGTKTVEDTVDDIIDEVIVSVIVDVDDGITLVLVTVGSEVIPELHPTFSTLLLAPSTLSLQAGSSVHSEVGGTSRKDIRRQGDVPIISLFALSSLPFEVEMR